jgi:hypothetical protein
MTERETMTSTHEANLVGKIHPLEDHASAGSARTHSVDRAVAAVGLQIDAACIAHDEPWQAHMFLSDRGSFRQVVSMQVGTNRLLRVIDETSA